MFNKVTFFDNVRITLYFGAFDLRMEKTFQLRYVFARHCEVILSRQNYVMYLLDVVTFLITFKLRYILVRSNYILKLRYKIEIY